MRSLTKDLTIFGQQIRALDLALAVAMQLLGLIGMASLAWMLERHGALPL